MKNLKFAFVEIKGGFGNQIFQLSFAQYLKKNGFFVFINVQKNWKLGHEFKYEAFGFKKSNKLVIKILQMIYKSSEGKKFVNFYRKFFDSYFSKYFKLDQLATLGTKTINYFDGYWQDIKILESQKEFIKCSLKKMPLFQKAFKKTILSGSTIVHIRRGDYVDIDEDLSVDFYKNAINYCKKNIKNFNYDIFTDDVEWVNNQSIFNEALNIYGPSSNNDLKFTTITNMFNYENYIIGNSTFSLIPAILSERENSTILISEPRFRHSHRELNFYNHWIRIKNI